VFVLLDAYLYMIGTSHAPLMRMVFSSMLTEKQMQVNRRKGGSAARSFILQKYICLMNARVLILLFW